MMTGWYVLDENGNRLSIVYQTRKQALDARHWWESVSKPGAKIEVVYGTVETKEQVV